MIFRIEIRKDGSIASCELVESALKNGARVFYVDADTPAQACSKAKGDWDRLRKRETKYGQCICGARTEIGRSECRKCLDGRNERSRERARLKQQLSADEYAAYVANQKRVAQSKTTAKGAAKRRSTTDAIWDSPTYLATSSQRTVLYQCLRAYDRDPGQFRAWILQRIHGERIPTAAE